MSSRRSPLSRADKIEPKSLVCASCWNTLFSSGSFQRAWSGGSPEGFSYKTNWLDLLKSAEARCSWCKILVDEIRCYIPFSGKQNPEAQETAYQIRVRFVQLELKPGNLGVIQTTLNLQIDDTYSQRYELHCASDDPAAKYIKSRDIAWEVSSPTVFQQASDLLQECTSAASTHQHCTFIQSISNLLPTRVIDCVDPNHPVLRPTFGSQGIYATLSYVWGEDQAHKTTANNFDAYMKEIPLAQLPRTIQDAIKTTKFLGLQYLWVDSICIIQDSDEDKAQEIAQMRNLYQNAFVTILAASARKVSEGFLQDRDRPQDATKLPFRCLDGAIGVMSLRSGSTEPEEPVDMRAWCFQERLLANRKLLFATDTLRYECNTHSVNIGNSNPALWRDRVQIPPSLRLRSTSRSNDDSIEIETAWNNLISNYTQRNISYSADKLLALYGVAELFYLGAWSGSRYLAGLWERNLLEELCWQKSDSSRFPRPNDYRAPSWSWAAIDGAVIPAFQMNHWGEDREECEIVDVSVTLKRPEGMFGEVIGGILKLKAPLRKIWWEPEKQQLFAQICDKGDDGGREGFEPEPFGHGYPDALEEISNASGQVWAIPLRSSIGVSSVVEGLIVVSSEDPGSSSYFRRIGLFQVPTKKHGEASTWTAVPPQEISVI